MGWVGVVADTAVFSFFGSFVAEVVLEPEVSSSIRSPVVFRVRFWLPIT